MVAFLTDTLIVVAFILRVIGLGAKGEDATVYYRVTSFQVLSFVSPLIWCVKRNFRLTSVFDLIGCRTSENTSIARAGRGITFLQN